MYEVGPLLSSLYAASFRIVDSSYKGVVFTRSDHTQQIQCVSLRPTTNKLIFFDIYAYFGLIIEDFSLAIDVWGTY